MLQVSAGPAFYLVKDGQARDLHIAQALQSINFSDVEPSVIRSQFGFLVLLNRVGQIKIACVRGLAEEACQELRACLESAEYQAIYDKIGQSDQFILVPGYFNRMLPLLDMDLVWLAIGLRQASRLEFFAR